MDKKQFIAILKSDVQKHEHRELLLNEVLQNTDLVSILFQHINEVHDKSSITSARIVELISKKYNLDVVIPYLDEFYTLLPKIKIDAVLRSFAKIIELFTIEYFIKQHPTYIKELNNSYLEQFTESCFDWMISEKAIAIQAHSMYALYLLGTKYDWIHPELIQVINKNLPTGSTGYQNRGKKILKAIKTNRLLKLQTQST